MVGTYGSCWCVCTRLVSTAGGIDRAAFWFVEAADVSDQLFQHGDFISAGRGFTTDGGDIDLVGFDVIDGFNNAVGVKGDDDHFLIDDFRIEDTCFFGFLADVIPDIVIERGNGCWRAEGFEDVGPCADARGDFTEAEILDNVAAGGLCRGASGDQKKANENCQRLHIVKSRRSFYMCSINNPFCEEIMMVFDWIKVRTARKKAAMEIYQACVAQSRDTAFYEALGVTDDINGRFDLISLHTILVIGRLDQFGNKGRKLAQTVFDTMFVTMDFTLREMGVGDLGVPKHMQKMMKAFNGRIHAYYAALKDKNMPALELALTRNVYRAEGEAIPAGVPAMAMYVMDCHQTLMTQDFESFMDGNAFFPPVMGQHKTVAHG